MDEYKLELTRGALSNISAMEQRVHQVACQYGENSDEHVRMLKSLVHALTQVFRLGGRVMAEDDLSLISDSFITYGCIFHVDRLPGGERDPLLGEWGLHS